MGAYYFILCFILINGITARKHRKWYVVSTFLVIFVFAALRKYTIGIDLELHYARNFERIAKLPWSEVPSFIACMQITRFRNPLIKCIEIVVIKSQTNWKALNNKRRLNSWIFVVFSCFPPFL